MRGVAFVDNETKVTTKYRWTNGSSLHLRIGEKFIHKKDGDTISGVVTDILHNIKFNSDYIIYVYYNKLEIEL